MARILLKSSRGRRIRKNTIDEESYLMPDLDILTATGRTLREMLDNKKKDGRACGF
jgi:hypothetical protein